MQCTVEELNEILKNNKGPLLLDVRSPAEHASGSVAGARCLPLERLEDLRDEHPAEEPVYVMCAAGVRSLKARSKLKSLGFKEVIDVSGGLKAWEAKGLPVLRSGAGKGVSPLRQVQMVVGVTLLVAAFVSSLWVLVPLVGAGLLLSGVTGTCLLERLMIKMPWNRA